MNPQEPLGLPRGSVRAILTLLIVVPFPVLVLLIALGVAKLPSEAIAFYGPVLFIVTKDYFHARGMRPTETEEFSASYAVRGDE